MKKRLLSNQAIITILISVILISAVGIIIVMDSSSAESISGKAYSDLSSKQKQGYWACYKEKGCGSLLKTAQQTKNYAAYRTCSKDCHAQALVQKPEDFYCTDSDGINYTNKGIVTSNFYPSGKEDYCLDINGKNYLFEGKCVNNKAQWVQKNCKEMGDYECEEGRCVEWEGLDDYFIKNKGELDCSKTENQKFCDEFNSAKKYYGFGTYELSLGDMVIIPPFIFKKSQELFDENYEPRFHIIWVNAAGTVNLIGTTHLNDAFQGIFTLSLGESLITITDNCTVLDAVCSGENCNKWCYTKPYNQEVTYKDNDVIGFAHKDDKEYNTYFVKSMQICYTKAQDFLGINSPTKKVYSRFSKIDKGGGCYADITDIGCKSTQETIDYFFNEWEDLNIIDKGGCVDYAAQPHELTHWIMRWSIIGEDLILNEGLADFVRFKVVDDTDPKLICKEKGYELGYGSLYLYYNLSKKSVKEGQTDHRDEIYKTSACVWDHIDVTYGHDKFLAIIKKVDELRFKPGTYNVFADIINPIIGKDILPELNEKFGLEEITITKEI